VTSKRSAEIRAALLKKGFREDQARHHVYYWFYDGNRKTSVKTYFSHGIKEYGDELLDAIKKQLGLTKPQLLDFIECPLSREGYLKLLLESGRIRRS
jgi:hypothetical protein